MLGYGAVAPRYPYEFPRILADSGQWTTASIGKDHFGWNATTNHGISHGYQTTNLYDGLGAYDQTNATPHHHTGEFDDYDAWFAREMPGKDPQATLDWDNDGGWNGWNGAPFVYDEYYPPTAWVGRQAIDFLQKYANTTQFEFKNNSSSNATTTTTTKPFLLKISFHRPHSPYDPPQRILDDIPAAALPPSQQCATVQNNPIPNEPVPANNSGHGASWSLRFRGNATLKDAVGCGAIKSNNGGGPDAWCGKMNPTNETMGRRAYAGSVRFVDEQIGLIYNTLVATQLLDTTFIIFTADHGDGQGDHFHWRKGFPYEFSSHVPMLLRWPRSFDANVRVDRGVSIRPPVVTELRDVFHTILDIANLTHAVPMGHFQPEDGKSMLCLLRDPTGVEHCSYALNAGPWRTALDLEHNICYNNSNHWSAITNGQMKYIYRANFGDEQLFDLVHDPTESIDVSGNVEQYGDILQMYRKQMVTQFETEHRGREWVVDGHLVKRIKGTTYSPNYPKTTRTTRTTPLFPTLNTQSVPSGCQDKVYGECGTGIVGNTTIQCCNEMQCAPAQKGAPPVCLPATPPFEVVWNSPFPTNCPYAFKKTVAVDVVSKWGVQVNKGTTFNGNKVQTLYNSPTRMTVGLWPCYDRNNAPINGGIPQLGNLSLHLDQVRCLYCAALTAPIVVVFLWCIF